jgi:hypothetical protein
MDRLLDIFGIKTRVANIAVVTLVKNLYSPSVIATAFSLRRRRRQCKT